MRDLGLALGFGLCLTSVACGAAKTTTRMVDDPTGTAVAYGAPRNTTYAASLEANKQRARITVLEASRCDVIPVTVVQRYEETLRGDEVLQRSPVTKKQVAGAPKGEIACGQTYARNVEVLLDIQGNRVSLGQTSAEGMVYADLARILETGAYATKPAEAKVFVRPDKARPTAEVGVIRLSELDSYATRVDALLAELEAILQKGETGATPAEITRSYEIYSTLVETASVDPRVEAIAMRFWELFYGRKQEESREKMGKNLEALGEAKETLKAMGDAAIPIYVQAAVNSGLLDRRALEWSSLRLVRALRGAPAVCKAGFSFDAVPSYGWAPDAVLASQYVNFGYGDGYADGVATACRSF